MTRCTWGALVVLVIIGVGAGCDGGASDASDATGARDVAVAPDTSGEDAVLPVDAPEAADAVDVVAATFDPTVCGAAPHVWLPSEDVGGVVLWDELAFSGLTASAIDALIAQADATELSPVPYGARNFALRYVTQDRGVLREATAVVGVPMGAPAGEPLPIVLLLHGATGAMDDCAPSRNPADAQQMAALFAALGYVVVAPDFLGMIGFGPRSPEGTIHSYLVGEPTALASLDAVRAALTAIAAEEGFPAGDPSRILLFGGSQGGHAAFFVDRYAPHYAPEMHVLAAVAAVPPTDLVGLATYGASHFGPAGKTLALAFTAMRAWYGVPESLEGVLTERFAASLPESMATTCDDLDQRFGDADGLDDIYTAAFLSGAAEGRWDELAPWDCLLAENSVATTSVPRRSDIPYFAPFGELDDLVVTAVEREDVVRLCAAGYRIEYVECAGKGHQTGTVSLVVYAERWMRDRLAGTPLDESRVCVIGAPADCDAVTDR